MHPLLKRILNMIIADLVPEQVTPAIDKAEYVPVAKADAIAELAFVTGDKELDGIHAALIDCLQSGYVKAARNPDGVLCFGTTPEGQERIRRLEGQ